MGMSENIKNKLWFSEADLRDSWMSCVGRFTEESQ